MRTQTFERDQKASETPLQRELVSIVIPTYNRQRVVGRAIQSVLDDSYPTKEIFVIDDGSVDQTQKVVEQMKNGTSTPVKFVPLSHSGQGKARNVGMKLSEGEYMWLMSGKTVEIGVEKDICVANLAPAILGYLDVPVPQWMQSRNLVLPLDSIIGNG